MLERGGVYLANLGKKHGSEMGKIRPVLVVQTNTLNRILKKMIFKGVIIMPLTTNLIGGDLRVRIEARDGLDRDSEICVNEIYTIDASRFIQPSTCLTTLRGHELEELEAKTLFVLGMTSLGDLIGSG